MQQSPAETCVSTPASPNRPSASARALRAARAHVAARRDALREGWRDRSRRRRTLRTGAVFAVLAVAVGVFFAVFDWDWLRGPISRYASAQTGRDIRIEGHLRVHPFSFKPWATVGGLKVGNPKWMKGGDLADLGRTTLQVKLLSLLTGHPAVVLLDIERPTLELFRDKTGRDNWTLGKPTGKPAALPPIQRFILHDGHVHMVDQKRPMSFTGVVSTTETLGGANAAAFHLQGVGVLNHEPFTATATGGPLLNVQRDRPYPFELDVKTGPTHVTAHGQFTRPFDLGQIQAVGTATGADLADLYDLTGVVFPNSPNYRLSADVRRDGETISLRGLNGVVGASDLHGEITVDKRAGRRFLKGDLRSNALNFADLNAVFGGSAAGKPKGGAKAPGALVQTTGGHILPDAPLYTERVRAMDAQVSYRADSVKSTSLPLRHLSLKLVLDHGLLTLDPIAFGLPHGDVAGKVRLDARRATPVTRMDIAVTNVRSEDVLPKVQGQPPMEGVIEARAVLTGAGDSVHKAAAAANGRITVALPEGRMRKALAELMGVNIVPGLFELWSKDSKQTDLRCAAADFDVKAGVLTPRLIVVDTKVVTLTGKGSANLGNETLDFTLQGKTNEPRVIHLIAPFHLRGTFARPTFKVDAGAAVAQVGIGAALAAFAAPLAAILPFLSAGGGHHADCSAVLAQARAAGAPVKAAAVAAAPSATRK